MATHATPGVYVNEVDAFPASVVPVATAVPAFIGYTPKAEYQGKSLRNKAQRITSFAEFQAMFMLDDPAPPAEPARQYSPEYYLVAQGQDPVAGCGMTLNGQYCAILPDPATIYYLYNSIRLFYLNGGGAAYIVSVGGYGPPSGKPLTDPSASPVNANVQLADLLRGLALLQDEWEPTMYICPEATLLAQADNATLMQDMLLQAERMQTAMCLFDVIGGANPEPLGYTRDIQNFRENTGSQGLQFGVSYYPFIGTTVMQSADIDFTNLFGGDIRQLASFINPPSAPDSKVAQILAHIQNPPARPLSNLQLNNALLAASQVYGQIVKQVLASANMLPPSGAMAGVYAVNDSRKGVWCAPANTSIVGAVSLPIRLTDTQQADLNVDAISGKSVNAIRFFSGEGIRVWGARTLDGNSQDWRYIPVRRTMSFIEQSVKLAARSYAFEPNNATTWITVKSTIASFLTNIWKEGGLQGTSPADAFQVEVGLGTTMTGDDLLDGRMRVRVHLAVARPAEFLVLTFEQQQARSGQA